MRWTALANGTIAGSQLVASMVLFKLLPVEAFGAIAMAHVVTGFADQLRELGTRTALVQRKTIVPATLNSAFLVNVCVGVALGLAVYLVAAPAAAFYHSETLREPLHALSALFVISSLGQVQRALLTRDMDFRKLAIVDLGAALTEAAVTIGLAIAGFGVWSFVLGELAMTVVVTLGVCIARPWWPGLEFSRAEMRSMVGFGANLMGFNLANYFFVNADRLIIGRVLGAHALGLYAFAQRITLLPMRSLSGVLVNVLVPRLARDQDDRARVATLFARACGGVALLAFPVLGALLVLTGPLIALYDPKWASAVAIVMLLCPVGMIQSATRTVGPVLVALGRPDLLFRLGLGAGAIALVGSLIGVQFGVTGVAVAFATTSLLAALPTFAVALYTIPSRARLLIRAVEPALTGTVLAGLVMAAAADLAGLHEQPSWLLLAGVGGLGAASYWATIALRRPEAFADLLQVFGLRAAAARFGPSAS